MLLLGVVGYAVSRALYSSCACNQAVLLLTRPARAYGCDGGLCIMEGRAVAGVQNAMLGAAGRADMADAAGGALGRACLCAGSGPPPNLPSAACGTAQTPIASRAGMTLPVLWLFWQSCA